MPLARLRMLLVDDDENQFALLDLTLSQTGLPCSLEWSSSHEDAVARITAEDYDLCFVDYLLERSTGIEFIRECIARRIATPMIMLTGHRGRDLAVEALAAGATDYLPKDRLDADTLERTVRYALERARIVEELRRSEERLRTTVARAPVAIFAIDADGIVTFADGKVLESLGLAARDLIGHPVAERFGGNRGVMHGLEEVLAGREFSGIIPIGEITLECHANPTHAADGTVTGLVGVATDVTVHARAEAEREKLLGIVEQERSRMARLVEGLPVVVWESTYGEDGELHPTFVSEHIETLTGYTPEEWLADPDFWQRLVHPDDTELLHVSVEELSENGRAERLYRMIRRDGGIAWIDVRFSLTYDAMHEPSGLLGVALDVTAQKLAEERLYRTERLFDSFMNNSPILNFIKDEQGRYLFVNEAFSRLVERPAAEVVGCTDPELFPTDVANAFRRNDSRVIESNRAMEFVERTHDDGRDVISHVVKFPLHATDGSMLLGGIAVDISDRVAAEESLRMSEERFLLSSRATNDVVYDWDVRAGTIWWNANLTTRFGYEPDEGRYGIDWWQTKVHPQDRPSVVRELAASLERGSETFQSQYRFERADGTWATVVEHGCVVRDEREVAVRMIGVMIDVSERVEAEEELRQREEEYRRIVETAQEGIWVTDNRGVTTFVNATMARMLGHSIESMLGTKFERYLDEEARAVARGNKERRERGLAEKYDLRMIRSDGTPIWTIVSANPIAARDGTLVGSLAMVTDITARRRAEIALLEANDRLEHRVQERTAALAETMRQLEKANQAQKRFVADASHDLRTPLTVVRAELDLLLASRRHDAKTRESLERALGEVRRLDQLASDLLTLATIDNHENGVEHVATRLDELLLESISNLTPIARERDITWNIDIDDAVTITCNRAALQRALTNVLDNALKYSRPTSAVDVYFGCTGNEARIVVADHGIGIAAGELPRIYDRFYRSDAARSTPGTGLGLPIVKSVVESHGGTLTVDSEQGWGTTVTIVLPLGEGGRVTG